MQPTTARILVVDDDVELQQVLGRSAGEAGYEVRQAFDGASGLALALREQFDLIVLDIDMPKLAGSGEGPALDGRDLLSRLKQEPDKAGIPVLLYSGRNNPDDRRMSYELGADAFVDKPIAARHLMMKIGHMIDKAREGRSGKPPS
jgi:two-component system, OmpR family, response regulator